MTNRIPARLRGVYYLFCGEPCVYIGSSCNLLARVGQHVRDNDKQFDSFAYHEMPNASDWDIEEFEIKEIRRLRPCLNVTHNNDTHPPEPIEARSVRAVKGRLCIDCEQLPAIKDHFVCGSCAAIRRNAHPYLSRSRNNSESASVPE